MVWQHYRGGLREKHQIEVVVLARALNVMGAGGGKFIIRMSRQQQLADGRARSFTAETIDSSLIRTNFEVTAGSSCKKKPYQCKIKELYTLICGDESKLPICTTLSCASPLC